MNKIDAQKGSFSSAGFHTLPVRVYYEETDAAGIVYYANYLRFAERARTELLREIGVAHESIKKKWGVEFVVRNCNAYYLAPAFLDDILEVRTTCTKIKGASITLRQAAVRNGEELVVMDVIIASRSHTSGKAVRIPKEVRVAFQQFTELENEV